MLGGYHTQRIECLSKSCERTSSRGVKIHILTSLSLSRSLSHTPVVHTKSIHSDQHNHAVRCENTNHNTKCKKKALIEQADITYRRQLASNTQGTTKIKHTTNKHNQHEKELIKNRSIPHTPMIIMARAREREKEREREQRIHTYTPHFVRKGTFSNTPYRQHDHKTILTLLAQYLCIPYTTQRLATSLYQWVYRTLGTTMRRY